MTRAGSKRIGALLAVLLIVVGAWALLGSLTARAESQVFGYLTECNASPTTPLGGVRVSLVDAQGVLPTVNATTGPGGLYVFTPPTGTYLLRFVLNGYYDNATTTPVRFDGSRSVEVDACLDKMLPRTISFLVHVQDVGAVSLPGALTRLYDPARDQVVASNTTNSSGNAILLIWSASLRLQVSKALYRPNETTVNTGPPSSVTVTLQNGVIIVGRAKYLGNPVTKGVVAYLYNVANVPAYQKILAASVTSDGVYTLSAIPGTYRMVVDADGFRANFTTYVVPAVSPPGFVDRNLAASPQEVAKASFVLGRTNWNALTVYRNLTWNEDSSIPGLKLPFVRSVALQVDYTFGNGNGVIDGTEWAQFLSWLVARGTFYVTTKGVFDVDRTEFNSTAQSAPSAVLNGGRLWINTSATYAVLGAAIPNGRVSYTLNLTMMADANTSAYRDQVYVVNLPRTYEMTTFSLNTTNGTITTKGWTEVTIDPGTASSPPWIPWIHMNVRKSAAGVARAQVIGPTGRFYVLNSNLTNYTAIVSSRTNLTFSARQSTDPVGDITQANFTWRFDNVSHRTDPAWIRYNIDTTFNYTTGGLFKVNLTIVEAGLNRTFRDFTLYVDDTNPVAQIRTNRTSGNANGTTLRLPEDIEVKLDGGFSSDVIYNGSAIPGKIFDGVSTPQSGYSWDFDGNGIADSFGKAPKHAWDKPGRYTVNLTITDSVGHKSVNATLIVIANDTTKPVPNYAIFDPSDNWISPPAKMVEGKPYYVNASKSTDNYDNVSALTFTWTVPGPAKIAPFGNPAQMQTVAAKTNGTLSAVNISIEWTEFNQSYRVQLNVSDTGFGWNNPAKRNFATTNITVVVQPDSTIRPNLEIVSGSLKFNPATPEEGQAINVTVQVRNQANRGDARSVIARLSQTEPPPTALVSASPQWYDDAWRPLGSSVTIASGKTVYAVFTISFAVQGVKSILVRVNDTLEPYTQVDGLNRIPGTIPVRQAGWVLPALVGGSIAVLVAIGVLLRVRSKVRAGELTLRRKKKELVGEEKEEEPAEEEKPREKRRL